MMLLTQMRNSSTLSKYYKTNSNFSPCYNYKCSVLMPKLKKRCLRPTLLNNPQVESFREEMKMSQQSKEYYDSNATKSNLQWIRRYSSSLNVSSSSSSSSSDTKNDQIVPRISNELKEIDYSSVVPINFDTSSSIQGEESQILEVNLEPNQILRAESGAMIYMTQGVQMSTSLVGGGASNSGISEGFKRILTGQNMFISDYTYHGAEGTKGTLALGTEFPSKIIRLSLEEYGKKIVCQKSAYLASEINVDIQMEFTKKFGAGFFGGEGFILQGLVGSGDVFIKAGGTLVRKELEDCETIRISSGSLVAFTQDVEYDIQTMPGFKNVLFGGEGLFVTTLTGPGTIWLQGMPPDRMISEITRRIPSGGGIGLGIPVGMGGGGSSGSEGTEDSEDGDVVTEEGIEEDLVASTDEAIEADRNATVASSGMGTDVSDAESSSALFGDVAGSGDRNSFEESSSYSSSESTSSPIPDLDDTSTFSTDDDLFPNDFNEDLTKDDYQQEQQFDDFQQDETSFSSESDLGGSDDVDAGSKIMDTLWDLFFNDDE